VNDVDRLLELSEAEDARDHSAAQFFKCLLIVSLCMCGLLILFVVAFAILSHSS